MAAPKELLRRGLLIGTEKLQGQLRDAAQGGRREDTEADRAQGTARTVTQRAVYRLEKLVRGRRKGKSRAFDDTWEEPAAEPHGTRSEHLAPATRAEPPSVPDTAEPVRIKTREAVPDAPPMSSSHSTSARSTQPQIKTRNVYVHRQAPGLETPHQQHVVDNDAAPPEPSRSAHQLTQPQVKTKDTCIRRQTRRQRPSMETPRQRHTTGGDAVPMEPPRDDYSSSQAQPLEQGRQKFIREQRKKTTARRAESQRRVEQAAPVRQQNGREARPQRTFPLSAQKREHPANTVRETVSSGRRIKETRSGVKAAGRTVHQAVKTAEQTTRKTVKTAEHRAKAARKTIHAAAQAPRRAVQAARATAQTTATSAKAVAKAAVSAIKAAFAAAQELAAAIAASGGAVIAVVLVLCLVGAILLSPLGIFFSGEENGGMTMPAVVREINQEYDSRIEELKAGATYDALSLSGSRAPWAEVLAVYAVKTTTDPANGLEVVTIDDEKKEWLKQVFWDMNQLSSFTSTVPGEGDEEDTTTLHITVTAKTADEMADVYGFNTEQRRQLTELLSNEYQTLWSAVLYGIGTGDGEIVAVALSQVGNIGGQPYWSWYGFPARVNWCAIFVSWCANECSHIDAGVLPKFSGCVQGSRWFKDRGLW